MDEEVKKFNLSDFIDILEFRLKKQNDFIYNYTTNSKRFPDGLSEKKRLEYMIYDEGVIEQCRDEVKFLSNIIMEYKYGDVYEKE